MPVIFGISLIGLIHMLLGTVLVLFVLVKYLLRPKKKKTAGYLIRDVHVIVGDGSELFHQNTLTFISKVVLAAIVKRRVMNFCTTGCRKYSVKAFFPTV